MYVGLFYYTPQYEISLLCFVCFFMSLIWDNIMKQYGAIAFWEDCQYSHWHVCFKIIIFQHHVSHYNFIVLFIFKSSGKHLMYSSEFSESMGCDLTHYVTLLWCRNSRRSRLCQEFCFSLPRGLQCSKFLLQQVPRLYPCYLFIAFPSLPTRRHHWHWLRCAKNLLMCLNYLCLMLGASVCSSALGRHYSCDGNSLRITALHPILLRCRERCHGAQRPL